MKQYTKIKVKQDKLVSVTCDKCKKTYLTSCENNDCLESQEFLFIKFTGGYQSVFGDLDKFECELCQYCVKELLGEYIRKVGEQISVWGN